MHLIEFGPVPTRVRPLTNYLVDPFPKGFIFPPLPPHTGDVYGAAPLARPWFGEADVWQSASRGYHKPAQNTP
jgi:hypothetical protein